MVPTCPVPAILALRDATLRVAPQGEDRGGGRCGRTGRSCNLKGLVLRSWAKPGVSKDGARTAREPPVGPTVPRSLGPSKLPPETPAMIRVPKGVRSRIFGLSTVNFALNRNSVRIGGSWGMGSPRGVPNVV